MNVRIVNETNGHVDIGNVYHHTCNAMRQLFTCDEQTAITVYVIMTNVKRLPRCSSLPTGLCRRMSDNVYIVYVKSTTHWINTLRHELYHVFQFNDGLPLCERNAIAFAALSPDAMDVMDVMGDYNEK